MREGFPLVLTGILDRLQRFGFDPSLKLSDSGKYYIITEDGVLIQYQGYHLKHGEFFKISLANNPDLYEEQILLREVFRTVRRFSKSQKQEVV